MPTPTVRAQILAELRQKLRPPAAPLRGESVVPCPALAGLLLDGGLRPGTLVEWLAEGDGTGAETLAWSVAVTAGRLDGAVVIVDPGQECYPPAAAALGVDLERALVLRPRKPSDALWAAEQSLRCPGVAAVMCRLGQTHNRGLRRLQLAAEAGGAVGCLLRPAGVRAQPSWADVRLLVSPVPSSVPSGRRLRIELLRSRKGTSGGTVVVDIDHETGDVHAVPSLAAPAAARRTAGA